MPYFAPAIPLFKLKHLIEREAQRLRVYLGLGPDEPIDAVEVADWLGIEVRYPTGLRDLPEESRKILLGTMRMKWSGLTIHLPNREIIVVLNPTHSKRRRQATLMEEVAHVHLGHEPSTITVDPMTGLMRRSYDKRTETEAYRLGSSMLVPKCGLLALCAQGFSAAAVAEHYCVSPELALFRINLCGLGQRAG